MSRSRARRAARPPRRKVLVELDLDGTGTGDISHRRRLLRPHAQPDRQARRLRPDRAHRRRPGGRRAPHRRGHRARAGRGVRARRWATRRASGGTAARVVPLDEVLVQAAVDLSGRPYVVHDEPALAPYIGPVYPTSMTRHVWESFGHTRADHAARDGAAGGPAGRPARRAPRGRGAVQGGGAGAARGRRARPARRRRGAVHQGRPVSGAAGRADGAGRGAGRRRVVDAQAGRGRGDRLFGVLAAVALAAGSSGCSGRQLMNGRRPRLRLGQPALGPAGAGPGRRRRDRHRRPGRRGRGRRAGGAGRRRVRGVHGRHRGAGRRAGHRRPGRGRAARCSASASACRCCSSPARSTASSPRGSGLLPGGVTRLAAQRVPHMGWNTRRRRRPARRCSPGWRAGTRFYFVHSYAAADAAGLADGRGARDHVRARRAVRRGGRARAAGGDPVPPGEVRRRRGGAAAQLGRRPARRARAWPAWLARCDEQGAGPAAGRAGGRRPRRRGRGGRARVARRAAPPRAAAPAHAAAAGPAYGPAVRPAQPRPARRDRRARAGRRVVVVWLLVDSLALRLALIALLALALPAFVVIALDRRT